MTGLLGKLELRFSPDTFPYADPRVLLARVLAYSKYMASLMKLPGFWEYDFFPLDNCF